AAAAVPTPCPITAHVAITRVEANATCVAEMLRPANIRLSTPAETHERSGMSKTCGTGIWVQGGWLGSSMPSGGCVSMDQPPYASASSKCLDSSKSRSDKTY